MAKKRTRSIKSYKSSIANNTDTELPKITTTTKLNKEKQLNKNSNNSSGNLGLYLLAGLVIFILLLGSGFFSDPGNYINPSNDRDSQNDGESKGELLLNNHEVQVFRTPDCGCCHTWLEYSIENGARSEDNVVTQDKLNKMKQDLGINKEYWSCHTSIIGNYFVEGHIPANVIDILIRESPDIDGISLPGMPSGSPGMGGVKTSSWDILAFKNGEMVFVYMSV
jgi:hypothetical protein